MSIMYLLNIRSKLIDLIRSITCSFSSLDCLYVLNFTLVSSKLEYASVANKLGRIQQKGTSVCFYSFSPHIPYTYTVALEKLGLHKEWCLLGCYAVWLL
jgi:hypothetical protein